MWFSHSRHCSANPDQVQFPLSFLAIKHRETRWRNATAPAILECGGWTPLWMFGSLDEAATRSPAASNPKRCRATALQTARRSWLVLGSDLGQGFGCSPANIFVRVGDCLAQ